VTHWMADITANKFYDWRERFGKVNEHNGWVPLGTLGHIRLQSREKQHRLLATSLEHRFQSCHQHRNTRSWNVSGESLQHGR
jgi:hypothetical protein